MKAVWNPKTIGAAAGGDRYLVTYRDPKAESRQERRDNRKIRRAVKRFAKMFARCARQRERFEGTMYAVFTSAHDSELAHQVRSQLLAGDLSFLPTIQTCSPRALKGTLGAYEPATKVIYVNRDFIDDAVLIDEVIAEQVAVYLASILNPDQDIGARTALFVRLLTDQPSRLDQMLDVLHRLIFGEDRATSTAAAATMMMDVSTSESTPVANFDKTLVDVRDTRIEVRSQSLLASTSVV